MTDQTITRARCRDGKHLIAIDRIVTRFDVDMTADYVEIPGYGPCPDCSGSWSTSINRHGPAETYNEYVLVNVKGIATRKSCSADCQQAVSIICKCSCAGAAHGMRA